MLAIGQLGKRIATTQRCRSAAQLWSRTLAIQKVGVVGMGLMGHGVAQIVAQAGYDVIAIEAQPHALELGYKRSVCIASIYF